MSLGQKKITFVSTNILEKIMVGRQSFKKIMVGRQSFKKIMVGRQSFKKKKFNIYKTII
jgi:hypothetical protein